MAVTCTVDARGVIVGDGPAELCSRSLDAAVAVRGDSAPPDRSVFRAANMGRLLLLLFVLLGSTLIVISRAEQASGNSAEQCDASVQCVDLNTCARPSERLSVPEEVVLVLGTTGCGKSTLTKYLSGHDQDMLAVREDEDSELLITGDRIGSGLESETTIPQLMTDNATGTHYVDCPGFQDTRGSCVEVSTTFYMKDIARHAKRVKVLLLAPYFAVRKGQDRSHFATMLLHAARTLRGGGDAAGGLFSSSVALVVTKVDAVLRRGRGRFEPVADKDVKQGVAAFLRDAVAPFLAERTGDADDEDEREACLRAADIVEGLLALEDGDYSRIGIFRAPDEEGKLNDIPVMEQSRQSLLDLAHHKLRFTDVQPSDFSFSVSERTKLFALMRSRALSDAVVAKMSALGAGAASALALRAHDSRDIPGSADRLRLAAEAVRRVAEGLRNTSSVQAFCERLAQDCVDWPQGPQAQAREVADECRYLDVLQVVSDVPLVDGGVLASQWAEPVAEASRQLAAREAWDRFLVALYDRLNRFDSQTRRVLGVSSYSPVSDGSLPAFVRERSRSLGLTAPGPMLVGTASDLNALLLMTSRNPGVECLPGGRVVVRAESVLLSEVVSELRRCPGQARTVEVYALNTVFLDADVVLPGVHLAVVAPRWETVGSAQIVLDGLDGSPWSWRQWEASTGQRGNDGHPGRPGEPGGSFLGVGREFVGAVRVSVNGGDGGDGQGGGAGGPGRHGGGDGASGGHGGAGGLGGLHGSGVVVTLGGPADAHVFAQDGAPGGGGRGGRGGDHRPHAGHWRRKRFVISGLVLGGLALAGAGAGAYYLSRPSPTQPPPPPPPQYWDGQPGRDGFAIMGRASPDRPRAADWRGLPSRLEAYFRLNQDHPYIAEALREFLRLAAQDRTLEEMRG